jgi:hypothetical protein
MIWTDGEGTTWLRLRPHGQRYQLDVDAIGAALVLVGFAIAAGALMLW